MNRHSRSASLASLLPAFLLLAPAVAFAGLGIEIWTDRGHDAVYQPGEVVEVKARASSDGYLLVYEIDAEGQVRLLFPMRGSSGFVEGGQTYALPPENSNLELVVQDPVGQSYLVAITSRGPFAKLPWYLLPYDPQAAALGYQGEVNEEDGVTPDGKIVGDPFVAMERIRRQVLSDPDDADAFATAYTAYYTHQEVRYPRYLCNDCHRPGHWAWWDGFDPYYASCSVFDFRVNVGWMWGPAYWYGAVPYYYYVFRDNCPPYYQPYYAANACFSSWYGWGYWTTAWGGNLSHVKTKPPANYLPPSRYAQSGVGRPGKPAPPGYLTVDASRGRAGMHPVMPIGRSLKPAQGGAKPAPAGDGRAVAMRRGVDRTPASRPGVEGSSSLASRGRPERGARPMPGGASDETPVRMIRFSERGSHGVGRAGSDGGDGAVRIIRPREAEPQGRYGHAPAVRETRGDGRAIAPSTPQSNMKRSSSPGDGRAWRTSGAYSRGASPQRGSTARVMGSGRAYGGGRASGGGGRSSAGYGGGHGGGRSGGGSKGTR